MRMEKMACRGGRRRRNHLVFLLASSFATIALLSRSSSSSVNAWVVPPPRQGAPLPLCRSRSGYSTSAVATSCSSSVQLHLATSGEDDYPSLDSEAAPAASTTTRGSSRQRRGPIRRGGRVGATTTEEEERSSGSNSTCDDDDAHQDEASKDPDLLTQVRFADRDDIHVSTRRALAERMKLKRMTAIQAASWQPIREGKSILGRSKTGTGKTLAFLLPVIERLVNNGGDESDRDIQLRRGSIGCLIVAPTRELAIQIADEAEALASFHRDVDVYCMYGGTKIRRDVARLSRKSLPTILVATPGRLVDHLVGHKTRIRGRLFSDFLKTAPVVVLDEADRLVESFRREVKQILSFLPRPGTESNSNNNKRQTLLFSATLPKRLERQFQSILPEDYVRVDCVVEQERSPLAPSSNNIATTTLKQQVNVRVDQSYVVLPSMDLYVSSLIHLVRLFTAMDSTDTTGCDKVVVFFPTARLVRFFVNVFAAIDEAVPIFEMHSRLSQSARSRNRSKFIQAKRGVLLTSDVSARGVDYPDVDLVIQYGLPFSGELYLHRLGRTARAGKQGRGLLVLLPFEAKNRPAGLVKQLGLTENLEAKQAISDDDMVKKTIEPIQNFVSSGQFTLTSSCESAFLSFIAHYVEYADKSVSGSNIEESAAALACAAGLTTLPPLSDTLANRLAKR